LKRNKIDIQKLGKALNTGEIYALPLFKQTHVIEALKSILPNKHEVQLVL